MVYFYQYFLILFLILILIWETKSLESIKAEEYYSMPLINDIQLTSVDQCRVQKLHKYCVLELKLNPITRTNISQVWNVIQKVNSDFYNYKHDIVYRAGCIRKTVENIESLKHFVNLFNNQFYDANLNVSVTNFYCTNFDTELGISDFIPFCIVGLSLIFILFCTTMSLNKTKSSTSTCSKVLNCFCLQRNWQELINAKEKYLYTRGIRFFNIIIIMDTHIIIFLMGTNLKNTIFFENIYTIPHFSLVFTPMVIISLQVFFYLSGFFLSLSVYKAMDRGQFNFKFILLTIVKRYLRLTPAVIVMMMLVEGILVLENESPYSGSYFNMEKQFCHKHWWHNILYISNIGIPLNEACLPHLWFLAADFQLYIMALLILSIIWLRKDKICTIFGITLSISILIPGLITYIYKLNPVPFLPPSFINPFTLFTLDVVDEAIQRVYIKSYTNASAYIMGLIIGYLFHKDYMTRSFKGVKYAKWLKIMWFSVLITTILIYIAVVAYLNWSYKNYNRILATVFASLLKPFFTCVFIFFIWGLHQNYGKIFLAVLEWRTIVILGRLTYCFYIVHLTYIFVNIAIDKSELYLTAFILIEKFVHYAVISYVLALVLHLTVEAPFRNIVKLCFSEDRIRTKKVDVEQKMTTNLNLGDRKHRKSF